MQIVGVDLLQDGAPIAYDYHFGFTGSQKADNTYQVKLPYNGQFTLAYLVSMKNEANTSNGTITSVMTAAPDTISSAGSDRIADGGLLAPQYDAQGRYDVERQLCSGLDSSGSVAPFVPGLQRTRTCCALACHAGIHFVVRTKH